jgi:hypothetical protein
VIVVGGGVAGLETCLALRALGGDRLHVTLIASNRYFVYRPVGVHDPLAVNGRVRVPLARVASVARAEQRHDRVVAVEPAARRIHTAEGYELPYDALVLAVGAVPKPGLARAEPFDERHTAGCRVLLQRVRDGRIGSLAFVEPPAPTRPFDLYDLAIDAAVTLRRERIAADLVLVTAAPAPLAPLVPRELARLVPAGELEGLPRGLQRADVGVNLHGSGPESHRVLLGSRPGRLISFEHPDIAPSRGFPSWNTNERETVRWCRMLAEHGIPALPHELDIDPPPGGLPPVAGATVIHPGAASGARRWPAKRFAAVARAELAAGRGVVITGSRDERALAREVAAHAGLAEREVLAGRTNLAELARVVAAAERVVCGDTGIAHLATALGTPSVVLFGPVSPEQWGPPPERPAHIALWTGGTGDPHASEPDPGLLAISVVDVLGALERLSALSPRREE